MILTPCDTLVFGASIFIPGMSHITAETELGRESQEIIILVTMVVIPNRAARPVITGTTPTHVAMSEAPHMIIAMIVAMS
jgi:hypothetical protein